jgi:hypothetical protein
MELTATRGFIVGGGHCPVPWQEKLKDKDIKDKRDRWDKRDNKDKKGVKRTKRQKKGTIGTKKTLGQKDIGTKIKKRSLPNQSNCENTSSCKLWVKSDMTIESALKSVLEIIALSKCFC